MVYRQLLISLFLIAFPTFWILFKEKKHKLDHELGLRSKGIVADILIGFIGFFVLILLTIIIGGSIGYFIEHDTQPVVDTILSQGLEFWVLILLIQVPAEEIFFRGFLVKRFGLITSAVLFGAAHSLYGSVTEVLVAVVAGYVLGVLYLRRKSIYGALVAHLLFNSFTLFLIFFVEVHLL